jgi:hypothetical protein
MRGILVGTLLVSASCGQGEEKQDACSSHLCEGDLLEPEGGNILFESIATDSELAAGLGLPQGTTTFTRVIAFFMNDQTPRLHPFPQAGACNNLETDDLWLFSVGELHVDLDVGTVTITGKNTADAVVNIDVPKQPAGTDAIGRAHDIFYERMIPDASLNQKYDSSYDVTFGGAGTVPPTTFEDAHFLSAAFDVTAPDLEDNGPLVADTDFPVSWTVTPSANLPATETILGIVWLLDTNGKPTHFCPLLYETGTFTIPGATIAEYRAVATRRGTPTDKAVLFRSAFVHRRVRLPNGEPENYRVIDMVSVNGSMQLVDVQAPAP